MSKEILDVSDEANAAWQAPKGPTETDLATGREGARNQEHQQYMAERQRAGLDVAPPMTEKRAGLVNDAQDYARDLGRFINE